MVPVGLVSAQSAPGSSRILHVKQINEDTGESNPDYDDCINRLRALLR